MELFKLFGTISVNNEEANSKIQETSQKAAESAISFEKIGAAVTNFGNNISALGTKMMPLSIGMGGLITAGIKYNSQMEQFQVNLSTLLGSSEKATALLSDLKEMASTTPFETKDLISATETMIGFGISANDAQTYLGYLGDISMGNSEKLKGLSLAFAQVQSTGKLTGQDLLQMINQGFNPLLYISKMTGESMAEVKERMSSTGISAEEVADAFAYATQEGQPFYNAMENGSLTIEGRLSTLKDNVMMLVGSITESLLPAFEKIVSKAMELVDKFNSLDDSQKEMIATIMVVVAALGPALVMIGKIISSFGTIISLVGKVSSAFSGLSTAEGILGGISASALGVVAAIGLIIGAFVTLWNNNEEFRTRITEIWNQIVWNVNHFVEEVKARIEPLKEAFENITTFIWALWQALCDLLAPIFENTFQAISDILSSVLDAIIGILDIFIGIFTGDWNRVWDGVKEYAKAVWDFILAQITAGVNAIKTVVSTVLTALANVLKGIWNGIKSVATSVWNGITSAVSSAVNGLKSAVTSVWNGIKSTTTSVWNAIKTAITTPINAAKSTVTNVINTIKNTVKNIFNGIKPQLKLSLPKVSVSGGKAPWGIGGQGSLPKFNVSWNALGGIFDQPTIFGGSKSFQGLGEDGAEAVIPLEKNTKGLEMIATKLYEKMPQNNDNVVIQEKLNEVIDLMKALLSRNITLDSKVLVGQLAPAMDTALGNIYEAKGRGGRSTW